MTTHHEHTDDHERPQTYHPRIWLASLADYTAGILHGQWVDATQDADALDAAARHLIATSTVPDAEEYAIFDYHDFAGFEVGENEQLDIVATVAKGIATCGAPYAAYAQIHEADPDMLAAFTDSYIGTYDSPEQWAEETLTDEGIPQLVANAIPEDVQPYIHIDYTAWAHDAALSGAMHYAPLPDGRIAVFQIL